MNAIAFKLRDIAAQLIEVADSLDESFAPVKIGTAYYFRGQGTVRTQDGDDVELTRSQATVLNALIDSRGVLITRGQLMSLIFGPDAPVNDSRTIDNHICVLRRLIGKDIINTVNGRGYRIG